MKFDHAAYRAEMHRLRIAFLVACIDIATHERDDSTTEIDLISESLAERLWPRATPAEWAEAFKLSSKYTAAGYND